MLFEAAAETIGEGHCVLLSSEQVFNGTKGFYSETDEPEPINNYGLTKFAAEGLAELYGNKTVRLSRCVGLDDADITAYLEELIIGNPIRVPDFIVRNYAHLDHVAEGILYFARHFGRMPNLVHLGGSVSLSFYSFMKYLAEELGFPIGSVRIRNSEVDNAKRPYKCGFDLGLARKVGLPIFTPYQAVSRMKKQWKQRHPS